MKEWIILNLWKVVGGISASVSTIAAVIFWLFSTFQTVDNANLINIELQLQMARNTIEVYETKIDSAPLEPWEDLLLEDAKWRVKEYAKMRQEAMGLKPLPDRPDR